MDKRYLKMRLYDDETSQGGTTHHGETLSEFLTTEEIDYSDISLESTNKILKLCGIKPINDIYGERIRILELANVLGKCKFKCENCRYFTKISNCQHISAATKVISLGYQIK